MTARTGLRALALLALVAVAVFGPVGAGVATAQPATDTTVTRVAVAADGDATWTLEVRTRLETESDVAAYERFQREFRSNRSAFLGPYRDRMRRVVAGANATTERRMAARNFSASTSIQPTPRQWGVVTYTFTWTGFARQEGDALVVGDVFENGLFLTGNDTIAITGPPGYEATAVAPDPDRRSTTRVAWRGERDFADGRPRVRFEPSGSGSALPGGPLGIAVVLLVVGGGAAAAYVTYTRRRRSESPSSGGVEGPPDAGTDEPPVDDAERVRRLLVEAGGRMKQSEIVEATGWSKSKVSRRLASMEDEGVVSRVQIGRENVVELEE